jgi:hypothetical protein
VEGENRSGPALNPLKGSSDRSPHRLYLGHAVSQSQLADNKRLPDVPVGKNVQLPENIAQRAARFVISFAYRAPLAHQCNTPNRALMG